MLRFILYCETYLHICDQCFLLALEIPVQKTRTRLDIITFIWPVSNDIICFVTPFFIIVSFQVRIRDINKHLLVNYCIPALATQILWLEVAVLPQKKKKLSIKKLSNPARYSIVMFMSCYLWSNYVPWLNQSVQAIVNWMVSHYL